MSINNEIIRLFSKLPCLAVATDKKGYIRECTDGFLNEFGFDKEHLLGQNITEMWPVSFENYEPHYLYIKSQFGVQYPTIVECSFFGSYGLYLFCFINLNTEKRLEILDTITENPTKDPDFYVIWETNGEGDLIYISDSCEDMFQVPNGTNLKNHWKKLLMDRNYWEEWQSSIKEGRNINFTLTITQEKGNKYIKVVGSPYGNKHRGYMKDVTDKKSLVPQLLELRDS